MSCALCPVFCISKLYQSLEAFYIVCSVFHISRLHQSLEAFYIVCSVSSVLYFPVTLITAGFYIVCLVFCVPGYPSHWRHQKLRSESRVLRFLVHQSLEASLCRVFSVRCSTFFCGGFLCTLSAAASNAGGDVGPAVISDSSACSRLVSSPWLEAPSALKPRKSYFQYRTKQKSFLKTPFT